MIVSCLSPDLLTPQWRRIASLSDNPLTGHCYVAAEAAYHMLGGAAAGWVPHVMTNATWPGGLDPGETHWFIKNRMTGAIVDPTAGQFDMDVDYASSRGTGFLTLAPSRRASIIIERAAQALECHRETAPTP